MRTIGKRARYDRDELRYPSDVTDAEWALIEPLIPAAKRGGRKFSVQGMTRNGRTPFRHSLAVTLYGDSLRASVPLSPELEDTLHVTAFDTD
jgi:hypothetical protein